MSDPSANRITELEAAVQLRDEQLAAIAHDLRGPLSSILLLLQRARDEVGDKEQVAGAAIKPNLDAVAKRLDQYVHHLGKLLEASKIETNGVGLAPEPIDLAAVTHQIVDDLRGARFRPQPVTIGGEEALVGKWDREAIEQIVRNLVSNALQYDDNGPIEIKLAHHARNAVLTVKSHGPAIAPEDLGRIFEKHVRASKVGKGFGLGLWIVRRAVEAMGGTVTVVSAPAAGTEFKVVLPRGLAAP